MTELLTIEKDFLANAEVKTALNQRGFNLKKTQIKNAAKKGFALSLELSAIVANADEWFTSDEGKLKMAEEGIQWTKLEFGEKVFGYKQAGRYFNKILRAGKMDERIVQAYVNKCDEIGEDSNRSIAGLIKFSNTIDLDSLEHSEDATEEEIAEAEDAAIAEADVATDRPNYIFTLSFKNPNGKNISLRVDESGNAAGSNLDELSQALEFMQSSLSQM